MQIFLKHIKYSHPNKRNCFVLLIVQDTIAQGLILLLYFFLIIKHKRILLTNVVINIESVNFFVGNTEIS